MPTRDFPSPTLPGVPPFMPYSGTFTITKEELKEMMREVVHEELEQYRLKGELRRITEEHERLTGQKVRS